MTMYSTPKELRDKLESDYKLLSRDTLDEREICIFFELADRLEDYDKLFTSLFTYPELIFGHFDCTTGPFHYNIEHKWNGDLENINSDLTLQDWHEDFGLYLPKFANYKLAQILSKKIFNKKLSELESIETIRARRYAPQMKKTIETKFYNDCKKKLKKFIVYVNDNNDIIKEKYPDFIRKEVQTHFKDLITAWNIKEKNVSFLWDIKIHHSYISGVFIDKKTHKFDIPYWNEYVLSTQKLRLDLQVSIMGH